MNELSELLEVVAHGITAVLAAWLGLLVLTRSRRTAGAPVFSFLCLLLVTWSIAVIVQRIGTDPSVKPTVNIFEDAAAFLLPAATTHIALSVAFEGRRTSLATATLLTGYAIGLAAILQAVLDPGHPIQFFAPQFAPLGIPGVAVAWAFAVSRLAVWVVGVGYLVAALRNAEADHARRQQLTFAVATVVLGVFGGMLRILPEDIGGPRWVGVMVVASATGMATYAVLAQHIFLSADVAGRAVRWSLLAGLGIVVYVGALVLLEELAGRLLSIEFPLVTALALVITLALFDPVSEQIRRWSARTPLDAAQARLLQALGSNPILDQHPERAMEPALARLVRTFELTGAAVVEADGAARASVGTPVDPDDPRTIRVSLTDGDEAPIAAFGAKRNGLAFTDAELDALHMAASYLGSTMRLAQRHRQQATALVDLQAEVTAIEKRGIALGDALADATTPPPGLHVYALGSLRAEMDGEAVRRWGGEKAGSRQAEAVFAFLFDRGDRGVAKDEILELVWPDVDLDRADVAFHRTMLGLRSMLRPGRRPRGAAGPIAFGNDRYRLDPSSVAWSDVAEFDRLLSEAGRAEPDDALALYERARALYRGDLLDDCPFYGDSSEVEERRVGLRHQYVDVLIELGERYSARGDRTAGAACLRQAQALAGEALPRVTDALARLTMPGAGKPAWPQPTSGSVTGPEAGRRR